MNTNTPEFVSLPVASRPARRHDKPGIPGIDLRLAPLAAATMLALAGCGGGGGGDNASSPPAALSITGTAATGAAIAGATVNASCAAGSGSATTAANGSFEVRIAGGAGPCVLRVRSGSNALHSVAAAGGNAVTANLTALAELVVARVIGSDPDALFANFDATAQAKLTPAALATAQSAVIAALRSAVDLTGLNPLAGDASVGGTLDRKLDAFVALMASRGVTLGDLTGAIASGSTDAATRLLQPVAPGCAGLRSGGIRLMESDSLLGVTQFDATTLGYVLPDGTSGTLTDNGGCSFTAADGTVVLFARSGLIAVVTPAANGKPSAAFLGIPDQSIALSELAGSWNYVAYTPNASATALTPSTGYFNLDAFGKVSNNFACINLDPCTDRGPAPDFTAAAGGGFVSGTTQFYAFKNDAGRYTMVTPVKTQTQFGYLVATKQLARTLPNVGEVTLVRSVNIDNQVTASAINDSTFTVLSVDAGAQTYTRQRQQDSRMETFAINSPRSSLLYRQPGAAPAIIVLPLPGNAASVFVSADTAHNFFGISIQHP